MVVVGGQTVLIRWWGRDQTRGSWKWVAGEEAHTESVFELSNLICWMNTCVMSKAVERSPPAVLPVSSAKVSSPKVQPPSLPRSAHIHIYSHKSPWFSLEKSLFLPFHFYFFLLLVLTSAENYINDVLQPVGSYQGNSEVLVFVFILLALFSTPFSFLSHGQPFSVTVYHFLICFYKICYIVYMYFFHIASSEPAEIHILILIRRMKKQTFRPCTCLKFLQLISDGSGVWKQAFQFLNLETFPQDLSMSRSFSVLISLFPIIVRPLHSTSTVTPQTSSLLMAAPSVISVSFQFYDRTSQYHSCLSNSLHLVPRLQQSLTQQIYTLIFTAPHLMTLFPSLLSLHAVVRQWNPSLSYTRTPMPSSCFLTLGKLSTLVNSNSAYFAQRTW